VVVADVMDSCSVSTEGIFLSPHPKELYNTGCPGYGHDLVNAIHFGMQGVLPPHPLCALTGVMTIH